MMRLDWFRQKRGADSSNNLLVHSHCSLALNALAQEGATRPFQQAKALAKHTN